MHETTQHLPFQFPGDKKFAFGAKLTLFLTFGFSIPFLASAYQLYVVLIILVSVAKLNFSSGKRVQELLIKTLEDIRNSAAFFVFKYVSAAEMKSSFHFTLLLPFIENLPPNGPGAPKVSPFPFHHLCHPKSHPFLHS